MKALKQGPQVPGWMLIAALVIGGVVLLFVAYRGLTGDGPRDPKTFPKRAYQPPGYSGRGGNSAQNPYTGRPGPTGGTSAGAQNPYAGRPGPTGGTSAGAQNPYSGYGGTSGGRQGPSGSRSPYGGTGPGPSSGGR